MSHPQKQQLLDEFADFLEQAEIDSSGLQQQPDLNTLFTEMAGLKAEVKAESRNFKTTLAQYDKSLELLQHNNKLLSEELAQHQQRLAEQRRNTRSSMLLEFLDVYDRLAAGSLFLKQYKPVDSLFNHTKKQDRQFIQSIYQGQVMTINRLLQLLESHQVSAIETVGKILNPHTMTAAATVNIKHLPQGQVVEELRKGFYFEKKVLRLAEVKVNKKPEPSEHT